MNFSFSQSLIKLNHYYSIRNQMSFSPSVQSLNRLYLKFLRSLLPKLQIDCPELTKLTVLSTPFEVHNYLTEIFKEANQNLCDYEIFKQPESLYKKRSNNYGEFEYLKLEFRDSLKQIGRPELKNMSNYPNSHSFKSEAEIKLPDASPKLPSTKQRFKGRRLENPQNSKDLRIKDLLSKLVISFNQNHQKVKSKEGI